MELERPREIIARMISIGDEIGGFLFRAQENFPFRWFVWFTIERTRPSLSCRYPLQKYGEKIAPQWNLDGWKTIPMDFGSIFHENPVIPNKKPSASQEIPISSRRRRPRPARPRSFAAPSFRCWTRAWCCVRRWRDGNSSIGCRGSTQASRWCPRTMPSTRRVGSAGAEGVAGDDLGIRMLQRYDILGWV